MAPPEGRTRRNEAAEPAAPTRRNTFQKMLDLERKSKIERMRASAQDVQVPHRYPASFQGRAPSFPSRTTYPQQLQQTNEAKRTHGEFVDEAMGMTSGAPVFAQVPSQYQTSPNTGHKRTWSESLRQTNSTDSYLVQNQTVAPHQQTTIKPGARTSQSVSLSAFDRSLSRSPDSSSTKPWTQEVSRQEASGDGKSHVHYELDSSERPVNHVYTSTLPVARGPVSMKEQGTSTHLASSLSAFKIVPAKFTVPPETSFRQTVPELDGSSDSRLKARKEAASLQMDQPLSSPIAMHTQASSTPTTSSHHTIAKWESSPTSHVAPQTPQSPSAGLQHIGSQRSSICRSPSWSATNGPGKKRREEEKRARKKVEKEVEEIRRFEMAKKGKEAKLARERLGREAREAKAEKERQENLAKAAREKEQKEARAAGKHQRKLSKQQPAPKKLSKDGRATSIPIVPSFSKRLTAGSRTNSFQPTDGVLDSSTTRTSFQTKQGLSIPDEGFLGGLKLDRARKAASNQQVDPTEKEVAVFSPATEYHEEDEEEDYEKDMARNAYHLALNGSSTPHLPGSEYPSLKREATANLPSNEATSDIPDLEKPRSPFYQMAQANNSFVEEIFNTVQNKHVERPSPPQRLPFSSHPSVEFSRSCARGLREEAGAVNTTDERTEVHEMPSYDALSFASRMAKSSGNLQTMGFNEEVKDSTLSATQLRTKHGILSPSTSGTPILKNTTAASGEDTVTVSMQNGSRRQVTVLEGVKTKSQSMLIEHLDAEDEIQAERKEAEQSTAVEARDQPNMVENKVDETKNRESRSSSRDSLWFRRHSKEEPKRSILDRRCSRSKAASVTPPASSDIRELAPAEDKVERPRFGRRNSISPTIHSFKAAAKAAFSKYGPAAPSSKANLPSSPLNMRPASSEGKVFPGVLVTNGVHISNDPRRQTLLSPVAIPVPSMAKAGKVLGDHVSHTAVTDQRERSASKTSSVSTKASDGETSCPEDDTSNITTPTTSRPNSKKGNQLSVKPAALLSGGRFREDFSAEFMDALDRAASESSPVTGSSCSIQQSPVQYVSSIVPTPIASPVEDKSNSVVHSDTVSKPESGFFPDAIARTSTLPGSAQESPKQEATATTTITDAATTMEKEQGNTSPEAITYIPSKDGGIEASSDLTRQKSRKSASTSNHPDLKSSVPKTKPEIDFSFLPALKHESLVRPPRAAAPPSVQAIAASLLGPPSSKVPRPISSTSFIRNGSLLVSPNLPMSLKFPGSSVPIPRSPFPISPTSPKGKEIAALMRSPSTGKPPRGASLPPQKRLQQQEADTTHSVKAAWLAAVSNSSSSRTATGPSPAEEENSSAPRRGRAFSLKPIIPIPNPELPKTKNPTTTTTTASSSSLSQNPLPPFQLHSNIITHPAGGSLSDPYAKCFLVCCNCKRFHDLPSRVYEMLLRGDSRCFETARIGGGVGIEGRLVMREGKLVCAWCEHGMGVKCCENWAVCVNLVERMS